VFGEEDRGWVVCGEGTEVELCVERETEEELYVERGDRG